MCLLFSAASEGRIRNLGLGGKIGTIWYFGTRPEFGTLLVPLGHSNPNFLLLQILVSPEKNAAQFSKTRGGAGVSYHLLFQQNPTYNLLTFLADFIENQVRFKQEHKVSYRCSLPSPLQKRSKDYKGLGCSASFELMSFLQLWQEAFRTCNLFVILGSLLQCQ